MFLPANRDIHEVNTSYTPVPLVVANESLNSDGQTTPARGDWHQELSAAIRTADELIDALGLPEAIREPARAAARLFPVVVPPSYLARMERGNPDDPLLRQVLPLGCEGDGAHGFTQDAVGDAQARIAPGLLHKYAGRVLLVAAGACAVHCRYCFRRHYPYGDAPRRLDDWGPALQAIAADTSIREVILSGGDPLMLTDRRLGELCGLLEAVPHVTRLRIHTRLPIVVPSRVTDTLLSLLTNSRLTPVVVVHANHPHEVSGDCAVALRALVGGGVTVLNQSVLLRGVNDEAEVLADLSERLIDLGVMPYYLHLLDRVSGTAHFEVSETVGLELIATLRSRLPGYGVPRLVREVAGMPHKVPIE